MVIFCAGMQRSGSTWSYNACTSIVAARLDPGSGWIADHPLGNENPRAASDRIAHVSTGKSLVIKTHDLGDGAMRMIAERRVRCVYTLRDPRDAVVSMHRMWGSPINEVIASGMMGRIADLCRVLVAGGNTHFMRYEDVRDRPTELLPDLARYLGSPLSDVDRDRIANELSTNQMRSRADKLSNGYDKKTLLHPHHVRDGRTGYWNESMTPDQASRLLDQLGDMRGLLLGGR
jgi:hypothetical protein